MLSRTLTRFDKTKDGVLGRLGQWCTLEEEDQGNQRNISCIPTGVYVCKRTTYHRGGYETFEVTGVPGRSKILFHIGNTEEDTAGCILLGKGFGVLEVADEDTRKRGAKLAVLSSGVAFRAWMGSLEGEAEFELVVEDYH